MATLSDIVSGREVEHIEEPTLNESFDNVVVVDNIPIVGEKRYERLCNVIRKIFNGFGKIKEGGLTIPRDPDNENKTFGFGFVRYTNAAGAKKAVQEGDNKKLDNKHKLRVNMWGDVEKYESVPEEYTPPDKGTYEAKANLTGWLLDEAGRDQFVLRYGNETEVFWNDPHRKANSDGRVLKYGGEREKAQDRTWTEQEVAWSTNGRYLATFHSRGIALWGGDNFDKLGRFAHPGVTHIDFSPCEQYLVTSNGRDRQQKSDPHCIQVWDIRSGKLMRGFDKGNSKRWPAFKWSNDDKFIARTGTDTISVYEVPGMGLLDKKSFKIKNVQDAVWSPTQNVLAYWVPEKDNIPAKVALLEIPSRKILREKHLYNVQDIKLSWQAAGDYLCVKIARKKTKKTIIHNFEIFRLRQKNIPVEVLEIEDHIVDFAWEPIGSRFAIIHGNPARPNVSLYMLRPKKLQKIRTLEGRPANWLYWSPKGDYLLVAGLGDKNGCLEFINVNDMSSTTQTDHHMCTGVQWDPSGRYVITSVTQPLTLQPGNFKATMENGYILWSGMGQQLAKVPVDPMYQVLWRPRPKTLFSKEQLAELKNNLKEKYWKKFEQEDDEIKQSQLSGVAKERADWRTEWKAFRAECERVYAEEAQERADLRRGMVSDDEDDYVEVDEIVEEEISCEVQERS